MTFDLFTAYTDEYKKVETTCVNDVSVIFFIFQIYLQLASKFNVSISNNWTVPMSCHARGLRAGMDGQTRQAWAATGERRPPASQNRRLGRRRGVAYKDGQTGGRVQARLSRLRRRTGGWTSRAKSALKITRSAILARQL